MKTKILLLCLSMLATASLHAWDIVRPPLSEVIQAHPRIVVGTVRTTTETHAVFEVIKVIKGVSPDQEHLSIPHIWEPMTQKQSYFKRGNTYLLFLDRENDAYILSGLTSVYSLAKEPAADPLVHCVLVLKDMLDEENLADRSERLLTVWSNESQRTRHLLMENFIAVTNRDPSVVPFVVRAFNPADQEFGTAQLAEHVIVKHRYVEAVPALLRAIERKHWSSVCAARALGKLKEKRAYEPILELINDPNVENRAYFIEALGDLQDARSMPLLLDTLYRRIPDLDPKWESIRSWDIQENIMAARALGNMRATEAVPRFIRILKLPGWNDYKCTIIDVLGKMGPVATAAVPALEEIAVHGDNELGIGPKSRAARALKQISREGQQTPAGDVLKAAPEE